MNHAPRSSLPLLTLLGLFAGGCADSGGGPVDAGPPPVDQCLNSSDLAIAEHLITTVDAGIPDAGPVDAGTFDGGPLKAGYGVVLGDVVQYCAEGECFSEVLSQDGVDACMTTCLSGTDAAGLSEGCRDCFLEVLECAIDHCISECIGTSQQVCDDCTEMHCTPRLLVCTGLPPL